jgi:DNA polymerase III subunit alpha
VTSAARMLLTLDVHTPQALEALRAALREGEAGSGRGEVLARLHLSEGDVVQLRLGRDFALDGETAEQLAHVEGLANVALTTRRGASHLKLVA